MKTNEIETKVVGSVAPMPNKRVDIKRVSRKAPTRHNEANRLLTSAFQSGISLLPTDLVCWGSSTTVREGLSLASKPSLTVGLLPRTD